MLLLCFVVITAYFDPVVVPPKPNFYPIQNSNNWTFLHNHYTDKQCFWLDCQKYKITEFSVRLSIKCS